MQQATVSAADVSRVIGFSSISLVSGEFDQHYKTLHELENCLLRVVAKALQDSPNSSTSADFEAQLGNWQSALGWEELKDLMSVRAEGFEDFFIGSWGTEALEANRAALSALFNYLLNIVSKFRRKRDVIDGIIRLHPREEGSEQPSLEDLDTTG